MLRIKKIAAILLLLFFCAQLFSQTKLIDSLKKELPQKKTDADKIWVWIHIANEYRTYNVDSCVPYAKKAVLLSEKTKPSLLYAVSISTLADAYFYQLSKTKRDSSLKLALQAFTKINDTKGICDTRLKNAGYIKFDGDLKGALTEYIAVNKEASKYKHSAIEAWSNTYLSEIFAAFGKYDEALKHAKLALTKMQNLNMNRGISEASSNMGLAYDVLGQSDSALFYYNISMMAAKKENLIDVLANTYSNIGVVNFYAGNYKEAIKNYELALELNKKLDYPESKANNLLNLGEAYNALRDYVKAEKYMQEGLTILNETHNLTYLKEAYRMMAVLYDTIGKHDKAYHYQVKFSAISDSLFNITSTNAVAEMQVKFDTEKKQKEIEIQHAKLDSQNAQLKEEQFQRLALYLGLGLVIVLGAFIYNRLTVTRKQKLEVEIQKKEVEKQKERVEEHQKEILDSIRYARRIQTALLPSDKYIDKSLTRLNKNN